MQGVMGREVTRATGTGGCNLYQSLIGVQEAMKGRMRKPDKLFVQALVCVDKCYHSPYTHANSKDWLNGRHWI